MLGAPSREFEGNLPLIAACTGRPSQPRFSGYSTTSTSDGSSSWRGATRPASVGTSALGVGGPLDDDCFRGDCYTVNSRNDAIAPWHARCDLGR
jgi:hypothetical protein